MNPPAVSAERKQGGGVAVLVGLVTVLGLLGLLGGAGVVVLAAIGSSGVQVPVVSAGPQHLPDAASAVVHGAGLPGRAPVSLTRRGPLLLGVHEGVSASTRVLAGATVWAPAAAAGAAALLLVPALRSMARRQPFAERNAGRLGLAAGVLLLGWAAASVLPFLAAAEVVRDLPQAAGLWEPVLRPDYWPLGYVALLAALSVATWHGRELAADTEGLV